jgi:acyl-CoA thioesterase-1
VIALCLGLGLVLGPGLAGARATEITLVAFGDSLTAGYGVDAGASFPVRLEAALRARGHEVKVINAGVSGDTSAAGLARLDWAIGPEADAVIVELGANDALRGLAPSETRANLDAIVGGIAAKGLPVLVAGMLAPRNLGAEYAAEFDPLFAEVAARHGAAFYPFFLDGVATVSALNQRDGMHPNADGVDVIVERMLPSVEGLIAAVEDAG